MAKEESKVTLVEYIFGFCSFIPLIGVLLGIISIILGALKFKSGGWKVVLLGVSGIFFTILLYGALFFFTFFAKNNMMDDMRREMSKANLRQCVLALEFYHQVHGQYPEKLEDLMDSKHPLTGGMVTYYDQSTGMMNNLKAQLFYYEKLDDGTGYYLLGRGEDGLAFTADDVYPVLSDEEKAHCGYQQK